MKKDKFVKKPKDQFDNYSQFGTKFCEGKCDRKVIMTKNGPVVICDGCMRIVIDNRNS